jgi:hypothetical protein
VLHIIIVDIDGIPCVVILTKVGSFSGPPRFRIPSLMILEGLKIENLDSWGKF